MKFGFVLVFLSLLASAVLANYEPINPSYLATDEQYQSLARGNGIIGPPYQEPFEYLLVFEPGWLHFVFSYPLDPGQSQEVEEYQDKLNLKWSVCGLEIAGQPWTAISTPVVGDTKTIVTSFLRHLKRLTFFVSLE